MLSCFDWSGERAAAVFGLTRASAERMDDGEDPSPDY